MHMCFSPGQAAQDIVSQRGADVFTVKPHVEKGRIDPSMTYVITQPCIGVKDASCVDVCPVDCIHPSPGEDGFDEAEQLFINPDECIDCGACEPACPVTAIFEESAVPEEWRDYIKINADFFTG